MKSVTAFALAFAVSGAQAWGTLGHATIAAIADNYLTEDAKGWVSDILGGGVTMPAVASWADNFRYTAAGRFSAPFQYVVCVKITLIADDDL